MVKSFQVSKKMHQTTDFSSEFGCQSSENGGHQSQGAKNPEKPISLESFCGKLAGWM